MIQGFLSDITYLTGTISIGNNVYLSDILDITIIAVLIYLMIYFLKQTRSLFAFIGVGMLVGLYALANLFGLFLTSVALQSFFGAFFVILAIIFQDELRRFFELLASIGTRQIKTKPSPSIASVGSIVQALASLAHKGHGALIVIPGTENIERHLRGGEMLDGIVSESMLESIFNPKNPGHDGAVVINQNRIVKFGTQLPLSKNFPEMKKRGTRHSAALGLSEVSDALVVVLSEENNTISIAKSGRLRTLSDPGELEDIIQKFIKDKFPQGTQTMWKKLLREHSLAKVSSLALAILIWIFSVFQVEIVQRDFTVPVTYVNVPENIVIENSTPKEITLTLAARQNTGISTIAEESIVISIDGSDFKSGLNEITMNESYIQKPFYVSLLEISASQVRVQAKEYTKASLPVELETSGQLPEGLIIDKISIVPDKIGVFIPTGQAVPSAIKTENIDLVQIKETTTLTLNIEVPPGIRLQKPAGNEISITIAVKQK